MNFGKTLDPRRLNGGVNMMPLPSSAPGADELPWSLNYVPEGVGLRTRPGLRKILEFTGSESNILHAAPRGVFMALGTAANVFEPDLVGNYLTTRLAPTVGTPGEIMESVQWNKDVYAVGKGGSDYSLWMVRPYLASAFNAYGSKFYLPASIPGPVVAPTIADGGAGVLPAGSYSVRYTYFDRESTTESELSPVSNTVTLTTGKQLAVSGLVAPGNPRFTLFKIYRSVQNQPGGPWLFSRFVLAVNTTADENTAIANLGAQADVSVMNLPDGCFSITAFNSRIWATDGRFVYVSHVNRPEEFDSLSTFAYPNEEVLQVVGGDHRIYIITNINVKYIEGSGATSWRQDILDPIHGGNHRRCAVWADSKLYWVSEDDAYVSDGQGSGVSLSGEDQPDKKLTPLIRQREFTPYDYTDGSYDYRHAYYDKQLRGPVFCKGSLGSTAGIPSFGVNPKPYDVHYNIQTRGYYPLQYANSVSSFSPYSTINVLRRKRAGTDHNFESVSIALVDGVVSASAIAELDRELEYDNAGPTGGAAGRTPIECSIMLPSVDFGPSMGSIGTAALKFSEEAAGRVNILQKTDLNIFEATAPTPVVSDTFNFVATTGEWQRFAITKPLSGRQSPMSLFTFSNLNKPLYLEAYVLETRQSQRRVKRVGTNG